MTAFPSHEDLAAWKGFVAAAAKHSVAMAAWTEGDAEPVADKLNGAWKRTRRRIMPSGQALVGSPLNRLERLAGEWRGQSFAWRLEHRELLRALVAETQQAMAQPARRSRADIDG